MSHTPSHWTEQIVFGAEGPQPQPLLDNNDVKMVLVGLEPQQRIPLHPAPTAVYYFIEGSGWMTVNDDRFEIGPGDIVRAPNGATRGIEASTRLVFLGTHGRHSASDPTEATEKSITTS